jgi:hypothetical protein
MSISPSGSIRTRIAGIGSGAQELPGSRPRTSPRSSSALPSGRPAWTDTIAAVHRPLLPAVVLLAAALTACGKEDAPSLPAECKTGPGAVRSALAAAPARVSLEGTAISGCVDHASDSADVQAMGFTLVSVAEDLAHEARRAPDGRAALELGYLVGAAERGAARTQGIHDELVNRLRQELLLVNTRRAAFRRGERAGRASG